MAGVPVVTRAVLVLVALLILVRCDKSSPPPPTGPGGGGDNKPPVARPGGPYTGAEGAAVAFNGSTSTDPDGDLLTYSWQFGDGAAGTGATPAHTYADNGTYTLTLTVTDAKGTASPPVTTTATIANAPPTVEAGPDSTLTQGQSFALNATFGDPGTADAPWSYEIDWGDGTAQTTGTSSSPSAPIAASHSYTGTGTYRVRVTVRDKDGGTGADSLTVGVVSGAVVLAGAGDIARCDNANGELTAALLDSIEGSVFTVGDHVEPDAVPGSYDNCYGISWGRHKQRTRPTIGNNDYYLGDPSGYFDYWGERAGERGNGFYSYNLGAWHIVVLNSNIATEVGSPQNQWLRADLAANTRRCILAIWHHPHFYTAPVNVNEAVRPLWDALYEARATLVVNGHRHQYERFAPQTPAGAIDPARGIRQFITGTGGAGKSSLNGAIRATNSEVLSNLAYGVLKFVLEPGRYSWEFIPEEGETFTDSGTGTCST